MSKGGAQRKAKQAEVMGLVQEAAEKKLLEDTVAEQQAALEREQRVHNLWWRCRWKILNKMGGLYSLPGEVIGAEIGEAMLQIAYQRMLANAMAQRAAGDEVKPGDIRLASHLALPSKPRTSAPTDTAASCHASLRQIDQEAIVLHVLSTAGRAGIRAVVAGLIVFAAGLAAAPSMNKLALLGVSLAVAFFAAALRVIQAYLPQLALAKYLGHPYGDWADSFLQGFVGTLIVTLPGILGAPNLSTAGSLAVAVILGAFTAGARAVQGLLTVGEHPAPATGLREPPNHYSYTLGAPPAQ